MDFMYWVLGWILRSAASLFSFVETVLRWSRGHLESLVNYPPASLSGLRWLVWILAIVIIIAPLIGAFYHFVPHFKRVLFALWVWVLTLSLWHIIRAFAMMMGWIVALYVVWGIVSWFFLLILPYIPK